MLHTSNLEATVANLCEADVRRAETEQALASANKNNAPLTKRLKGMQERRTALLARLKVKKKAEAKNTEEKHKAEVQALQSEVNATKEKHKAEVQVLQSEVYATKEKVRVLTAQVIALEEELQAAKAVRFL